eukprot:403346456
MLSGATYLDLQDTQIQSKIASYLKQKGLALHVDNHFNALLHKSQNGQTTHPSLLLYSAVSQSLYFDDSRYLDVRHELISFLNNNLRTVQTVMGDICHPRETINSLDAKEFLDSLEDPSNDQTILLAFCAVALNYNFTIIYFNERNELAQWEYSSPDRKSNLGGSPQLIDNSLDEQTLTNLNHKSEDNFKTSPGLLSPGSSGEYPNMKAKHTLGFLLKSSRQVLPLVDCEAFTKHQFMKLFQQRPNENLSLDNLHAGPRVNLVMGGLTQNSEKNGSNQKGNSLIGSQNISPMTSNSIATTNYSSGQQDITNTTPNSNTGQNQEISNNIEAIRFQLMDQNRMVRQSNQQQQQQQQYPQQQQQQQQPPLQHQMQQQQQLPHGQVMMQNQQQQQQMQGYPQQISIAQMKKNQSENGIVNNHMNLAAVQNQQQQQMQKQQQQMNNRMIYPNQGHAMSATILPPQNYLAQYQQPLVSDQYINKYMSNAPLISIQEEQEDRGSDKPILNPTSQPFVPKKNFSTTQSSMSVQQQQQMQQMPLNNMQQQVRPMMYNRTQVDLGNVMQPQMQMQDPRRLVSPQSLDFGHLQHQQSSLIQNQAYTPNLRQFSGMQVSERSASSFVRIDDIQALGAASTVQSHQQTVNPDEMKVTGTLKFFYEGDHYGFLVGDADNKDVFFHMDDMKGTKLTKEQFANAKDNYTIRFAYNKLAYFGRYGLSMKAINIDLVEIVPLPPSTQTQAQTQQQ